MPGSTRYHAPPVSYPVGRCLWEGRLWVAMCLLLLGSWAVAGWQGADPREHGAAARFLALGMIGWLALAAWAAVRWRQSPRGQLLWRAGQWLWWPEAQTDAVAVEAVTLAWDGQGLLLLRLEGAKVPVGWLWLERWRDPARWDDLRRAVWAAKPAPAAA